LEKERKRREKITKRTTKWIEPSHIATAIKLRIMFDENNSLALNVVSSPCSCSSCL
jgi:hypothetical protein